MAEDAPPKQQFWVLFSDPNDGEVVPPIGPFDIFDMQSNFLIVMDAPHGTPGRVLAEYHSLDNGHPEPGWYINRSYWKRTGLAPSGSHIMLPKFNVEIRPEPPLREFTVHTREIVDCVYKVMARDGEQAKEILTDDNTDGSWELADETVEEMIIGRIEEVTEMSDEEGDPT